MADLVVVYRTDTGAAVSTGSTVPATVPAGLAVKTFPTPTWEQFSQGGWLWDPATLAPQPVPVDITLVVEGNLRTRLDQRLAYAVDTLLPKIDAADVALDAVRAAAVTNTAEARTQIRELARIAEDLTDAERRTVKTLVAVIRILLGSYYGDPAKYLSSDAGSNGT